MKIIDSRKIEKILDENIDPIDLIEDFNENKSPCWEVRIDKEKNKMLFIVDGNEKMSSSLIKFKPEEITVDLLSGFIKLFREGNMNALKKAARVK